ncbi:MAG: ABC transporter ATP-binding protein [Lachnospiraceae bacterium]|nr:ABC transporter ATP-binding protein [Lachnospiraceae bacterium]
MFYRGFIWGNGLFEWLIFSVSLFAVSAKLGWKGRWKAFIPGQRFYALGESLEMYTEGRYCGFIDLLFVVAMLSGGSLRESRTGVLASLIHFVLFIFLFIYRIRIFLEITKVFGLRKRWILLWLISNWITLLILGVGKRFQPVKAVPGEEQQEAGAEAPGGNRLTGGFSPEDQGLSISIKSRATKDFGKTRYLLKDIAMNIPDRSLVLLLGGSGAGKTTLLNAITGYEKADAEIRLNGTDVYKDYSRVKHKIGFVPQQNLIRGKDTVIRTVNDAAVMRLPRSVSGKERNTKIKEVMDLLGLTTGQDGLVSKKSGGQLRRICIATELITDPELFILDEPDSGLDGVISREIFTKLRQIADEGRIVIVITHTPDRVIDLFDKVIVLAKDSDNVGRLAFYGSPSEAREFFGHETMEQVVMCLNSKEEGGEGRSDEFIGKYELYAGLTEGGSAS